MDLRTERTKRSIINSFLELRAKKSIEKITVKELAELAFINKATFYSHYSDIYELAEQLEEETIAAVLDGIPHPEYIFDHPKQAVYELTMALTAKEGLVQMLFSGSREGLLMQKLEEGLKERIYAKYPQYRGNLKWDIVLSVIITGNFHAFSEQKGKNVEEVCEVLGDISECLKENFLK